MVYDNEVNSGEYILHAPIITGFKKVQRTLIEPLRAFQISFYLDLMDVEKIIIIGYSFSDPYINNLLLTHQGSKEIICVDYCDENSDINTHFPFQKFVRFFNDFSFDYEDDQGLITFKEKPFKFYYKGFEKFLAEWKLASNKILK